MHRTNFDDRILHMSQLTTDHLDKVRAWAVENGHEQKLDDVLNYVRQYSGGPELYWKTVLNLDVPCREDCKNFIATIYRRPFAGRDNGLMHYMTIGIIWSDRYKEWSTHT